jgi:hypothetical protein
MGNVNFSDNGDWEGRQKGATGMIRLPRILHVFALAIVLLFGAASNAPVFALCGACWELKGIAVDLEDGTTVTGYIGWNEDAIIDAGYQGKFPEVLLEMERKAIVLYTDLEKIVYPVKGALVSTKQPLSIPVGRIIRVLPKPGPHDGYRGAVEIPLVSPEIAALLRSKPDAFCEGDEGGVTSVFWLAYNKRISSKDIIWLCRYPWVEIIRNSDDLQKDGVFRLDFPYD